MNRPLSNRNSPDDAVPENTPLDNFKRISNLLRIANKALVKATDPIIGVVTTANKWLFDPVVYRVPFIRQWFFQPIGRIDCDDILFGNGRIYVAHMDEENMSLVVKESPFAKTYDGSLSEIPFTVDLYIDDYISEKVIKEGAILMTGTDEINASVEDQVAEEYVWFGLHGTPTRESRDKLQKYGAQRKMLTIQHTYEQQQFTISSLRLDDLKLVSKVYWPDIDDTPKRRKTKNTFCIHLAGMNQALDITLFEYARKLQATKEDMAANAVTIKFGKAVGMKQCRQKMKNYSQNEKSSPIHGCQTSTECDFILANYSFVRYPMLNPTPASVTVPVTWSLTPDATPTCIEILHCHPKKGKLFDVVNTINQINNNFSNGFII